MKEVVESERILQFGGGNFLRGYFNWMLSFINEPKVVATAVLIKPTPHGSYATIRKQQGKFHTILSGSGGNYDVKLIDNITDVVNPYDDFDAFLAYALKPKIDIIVSNTTESGIRFVAEDLPINQCAQEFPGKLTQWLHHRFLHCPNVKTLVLPCELIERNGENLLQCVTQTAHHWQLEPEFVEWLGDATIFCNTLVDRIVSGKPEQDVLSEVHSQLTFDDNLAVVGELYHHWVIQADRPIIEFLPFEHPELNIDVVPDLDLHREMKVKILNGLHTMMVPLGLMSGCKTVADVMIHKKLFSLLQRTLTDEILPTIHMDNAPKSAYAKGILQRFRNTKINHRLASIALNSLDKFKVRVMPTLLQSWQQNGVLPAGMMRSWAALLIFYRGQWQGDSLPVKDSAELVEQMSGLWQEFEQTDISLNDLVEAILSDSALCLEEVASIPKIVTSLRDEIQEILSTERLF